VAKKACRLQTLMLAVSPSRHNTTAATCITVVQHWLTQVWLVALVGSWLGHPVQAADLQAVDLVAEHFHLLLVCTQGHAMRGLHAAGAPQDGCLKSVFWKHDGEASF